MISNSAHLCPRLTILRPPSDPSVDDKTPRDHQWRLSWAHADDIRILFSGSSSWVIAGWRSMNIKIVLDFWAVIWAASSIHYEGYKKNPQKSHTHQHTLIDASVVGPGAPNASCSSAVCSVHLSFSKIPFLAQTICCQLITKTDIDFNGSAQRQKWFNHRRAMSCGKMCWPHTTAIKYLTRVSLSTLWFLTSFS